MSICFNPSSDHGKAPPGAKSSARLRPRKNQSRKSRPNGRRTTCPRTSGSQGAASSDDRGLEPHLVSGAALTDRSYQATADCGFFPAPRARNFLGYRREFLPARGLIVRNVHIGKPRARRGVCWPPGSGLFAADATRTAAFGARYIKHSTNPYKRPRMLTAVPASRSHPQRPEERCTRQFLLARPDEIHALGCGTGGWIEPTRFLVGARTQESSSVRDVMKTEPFGKPAIWMYQFW
jgi:hypothetical protein